MDKKSLSWILGLGAIAQIAVAAPISISGNDVALKFNPEKGEQRTLVMPDGKTVKYVAYEKIYYVTNVEDSTYQYLNFYVPESALATEAGVPIFFRTYTGGYMAAKAEKPSETDATGRALLEGYAVCIPGSRGWNAEVSGQNGKTTFTGRAPAGLVDLKAAIRYLRFNDAIMPGDAEKIITDGTSAGGAMSALLGTTGNNPAYEPYLKAMGAANARDDVYASVCYCPITDLNHADMAYEWLYGCTNRKNRQLNDDQDAVSKELAAAYPAYLNSLGLKRADGTPLTDQNYLDYIKHFLIKSAQKAIAEGGVLPDDAGIIYYKPNKGGSSEFVADIDMDQYLNYVVSTQPLKTPPAFDALHVLTDKPTPENQLFGDRTGNSVNFTSFSLLKATGNANAKLDSHIQELVRIMNPMNFIQDSNSTHARYWYIRHGARDRDTSFPVPVNLATKLMNAGYEVDFALPWNRPHTGDYNLDDLFDWIKQIL